MDPEYSGFLPFHFDGGGVFRIKFKNGTIQCVDKFAERGHFYGFSSV
jgi:hypothetical protein